MKEIEILIVTYNQQDLIGRALDSILSQAEFGLKDIIVCDDCSTDGNWDVISDYARRYPQYVRAYRNEPNLGIYGNWNRTVSLHGEADLYYLLSGDDALCPGIFERLQEFTRDMDLDGVAAAFYCDWKIVSPDGREKLFSNAMADKGFDNRILKMRGLVSSCSLFLTRKIIEGIRPVDLDHGVAYSEEMFDIQPHLLAERFYHIPYTASIYYSEIGVSTRLRSMNYYDSDLYKWNKVLETENLSKKDSHYVRSRINMDLMYKHMSFRYFFPAALCSLLSADRRYGFSFIKWAKSWYGVMKSYFKYKRK